MPGLPLRFQIKYRILEYFNQKLYLIGRIIQTLGPPRILGLPKALGPHRVLCSLRFLDLHRVLGLPRVLGPHRVLSPPRVLGPHMVLGPHRVLCPPRVLGPGSSQDPGSRFSGIFIAQSNYCIIESFNHSLLKNNIETKDDCKFDKIIRENL